MGRHQTRFADPQPVFERTAARLREARASKNLTLREAAAVAGTTRQTLGLVEKARRSPTVNELEMLAALYQRTVSWILGYE